MAVWLSIDLGLHNLMTCFDNAGATFIVGRQCLSICRNDARKISQAQSQWGKTQAAHGVQYPKTRGHILELYHKKNQCVKDCLHKMTTAIADYCEKNEITRAILGDIAGIRKDKDLGAKTNQKLHGLPFAKICAMLRYKLAMRGILLVLQEERYTSQCSPLSPEVSKRYAKKSNRICRELYKDGNQIWNADSVGAFTIMRKWLKKAGLGQKCWYGAGIAHTFHCAGISPNAIVRASRRRDAVMMFAITASKGPAFIPRFSWKQILGGQSDSRAGHPLRLGMRLSASNMVLPACYIQETFAA